MQKKLLTLIFVTFFLTPLPSLASSPSLHNQIQTLYTRESTHLDTTYSLQNRSWQFNIPYYRTSTWENTRIHPRYHMSAAAYYRYRLDEPTVRSRVRNAILDSTVNYHDRIVFDQSFNDAIANFLIVRLLETDNPPLFNNTEERVILTWINKRIPFGLIANDTENRAALGAVYWLSVAEYLYKQNIIEETRYNFYQALAKQKIEQSIHDSLDRGDFVYREDGQFSLHYHLVEAYMLLQFGVTTDEPEYIETAREMTNVINQLSREDGFLDASLGHRPSGNGAQTYLLAGMLNEYFENEEQSTRYYTHAFSNRFFIDTKHPDRMVWYDTSTPSPTILNDDISFVNMAELMIAL